MTTSSSGSDTPGHVIGRGHHAGDGGLFYPDAVGLSFKHIADDRCADSVIVSLLYKDIGIHYTNVIAKRPAGGGG